MTAAATVIAYPQNQQFHNVMLHPEPEVGEDEFLALADLAPLSQSVAERSLKQVLSEIAELTRNNRWQDILALCHPVAEKLPELVEHGLDTRVRYKLSFALGQIRRFDEAMKELQICVEREPEDFYYHSSLAYTAYNSLYAAKAREIVLGGKLRADRVKLAHQHFEAANRLRPDGVTNFYRRGMLFKQLENKPEKGLPLFLQAVANWETRSPEEQQARHQEHKNYVKSLYQAASSLVATEKFGRALELIQRCLAEDENNNHLSLLFKHFALGKTLYHLNRFTEARDALVFATRCSADRPADFVYELLGRTFLALKEPEQALEVIQKVPEKLRRPYYRWTEADILCALKDLEAARRILQQSSERDNRSRHKSLMRLCKLEYLRGDFAAAECHAGSADQFYQNNWQKPYSEGLFWQALCAWRQGRLTAAREMARSLQEQAPGFPKLNLLLEKLAPNEALPAT